MDCISTASNNFKKNIFPLIIDLNWKYDSNQIGKYLEIQNLHTINKYLLLMTKKNVLQFQKKMSTTLKKKLPLNMLKVHFPTEWILQQNANSFALIVPCFQNLIYYIQKTSQISIFGVRTT